LEGEAGLQGFVLLEYPTGVGRGRIDPDYFRCAAGVEFMGLRRQRHQRPVATGEIQHSILVTEFRE
jgi:hypothetical protein